MHVCVVTETYPPEINGVARSLERAVRHLRYRGHEVSLVRPRQPGDAAGEPHRRAASPEQEVLARGVPLPMYRDLRFGMMRAARLIELWRGVRPDIVHVATEGPLGLAAVNAARRLRIPCSSDYRTNFHLYSRHYHLGMLLPLVLGYLRWFHNRTDATIVATEALRMELACEGFRRLQVVGRGVDTGLFSPVRRDAALRAQWGAGERELVVLHVGRIAAEKNIATVIAAFRSIRQRNPASRLVFVGDGPLRPGIERRAPDAVFTGWLRGAALAQAYASADLFLFPSMTETFGNVLLEALASGLACVAYDHAAAGQHLDAGVNGARVRLGDAAAFVQAACDLAMQPALRARMGEAARATAESLGWEHVLDGFERVLRGAASRDAMRHAEDLARAA